MKAHSKKGFTLIELLTVIAIIGILASILIPTVGMVQKQARKAKSKAIFGNWIQMVELFKQEYGYYPPIGTVEGNDRVIDLSSDSEEFLLVMTAQETGDDPINKNKIDFGDFAEDSFEEGSDTQLVDAFGNANIRIVMDANRDGELASDLFDEVDAADQPEDDLRAAVAIFSVPDDVEGFPSVTTWN